MRENRPYGLAGGETELIGLPYPDLLSRAKSLESNASILVRQTKPLSLSS